MSDNWRENELSLKEVIAKYPEFPPLIALKIDVDRRGVSYTQAAFDKVDLSVHQTSKQKIGAGTENEREVDVPMGITYRDGTVSCSTGHQEVTKFTHRDPYVIDVVDGKLFLFDQGEQLEEITYWEKPDFWDKKTSNGTPMRKIATARPQRITIDVGDLCHFWDKPGNGCKYCSWQANALGNGKTTGCTRTEEFYQDVYETFKEALKQKGRFSQLHVVSGSVLTGEELFDDEVDHYIKVLQAANRAVDEAKYPKFPIKMVASAFSKKQLERLYKETPQTTYSTDLEVLNEELFKWICPGKAEFVTYQGWKKRLFDSVEVFGRGNVTCGLVGGVELAQPNGFKSEDEALEAVLAEANDIAEHGVTFAEIVWQTRPGSAFVHQKVPSLEYYVRLAQGLADARRKNGLHVYTDDYRRCGNHPNSDLSRID